MNNLELVESWITVHLSEFLPPALGAVDENLVTRLKPTSELALISDLLLRRGRVVPRTWLEAIWSSLKGGDLLSNVLTARPDLLELSALVNHLGSHGYSNNRCKTALAKAAGYRSSLAQETPSWRKMAVAYNLEKVGVPWPYCVSDFYPDSWLGALPEPWLITIDTAYAATHTLFYLTDFGADHDIAADLQEYLSLWIPVWIEHFRRQSNYDIIAELVLSLCYIGRVFQAAPYLALLERSLDRDGSVEGPRGAGRSIGMPSDSLDRQRFLRRYHTTLVVGLALGTAGHGVGACSPSSSELLPASAAQFSDGLWR